MVGAHFDYRELRVCGKPEQSKGYPDMVIQITGCTYDIILTREHCMDQFLGGGFSVGTGYSDDRDVKTAAMMPGKVLQCGKNIFNQNATWTDFIFRFINDHPGGALQECGGSVMIPVKTLAFQGKEDAGGSQVPCICNYIGMLKKEGVNVSKTAEHLLFIFPG